MPHRSVVPHGAILLIDDDDFIAGSLRDYLASLGWSVDVAVDAASARERMLRRQYAVVLVDPYFTGALHAAHAPLINRICEMQPGAAIIILTGYASPALGAPMERIAAILSKPQPIVALSDEIIRTLNGRLS